MPNEQEAKPSDDAAGELRSAGTDLVGAVAGGSLGLVGGPAGAIGGAALGVAVQHAARALIGRLNRREQERVGAALLVMDEDARQREERGERPREDGFFDDRGTLRPEAEDLLEAVLRRAAGTYEERKLPLLARLYSACAHDATISAAEALYLIRVADELTYREFVALALLAHPDEHERSLTNIEALHETGRNVADESIRLELSHLADLRLVGISANEEVGPVNNVFAGLLPRGKATYAQLGLLTAGRRLVETTGADEIGTLEREKWLDELTGPGRT